MPISFSVQIIGFFAQNSRLRFSVLLLALWLLPALIAPSAVRAHGGVIIDGDFTEEYEWLAAVSPYPATPGDTVITLLLYDLETYAPINGMDARLYLDPPEDGARLGPFNLLTDPEQYPGDYSNILDLTEEGDWGVLFAVDTGDETLELTTQFTVQPGDPNAVRPTPEGAADVAATATAFAQNVADARQAPVQTPPANETAVSPLASPLETTDNITSGTESGNPGSGDTESAASVSTDGARFSQVAAAFRARWWLWSTVAILPFALLFFWFWREPGRQEPAQPSAGSETNEDEDEVDIR